jgi:hypothetical protein
MSWPGIKPVPPRRKVSTLEKRHLNSLLKAIQNIYRTYYPATIVIKSGVNDIIKVNGREGPELGTLIKVSDN